jgi:LDH2 family malate/lactate/ureidoglycolate dehydrogenase
VAGSEQVRIPVADAESFAVRLLSANGVPPQDAAVVARCLVLADMRGVSTHGLSRLPGYLKRLSQGLINPAPRLEAAQPAPAATIVDGQNGFGFVVGTFAMSHAIASAKINGIGLAGARRSTHFGMAACYALQAIAAGMVAMIFTNASRAMPPYGGREALFGTSPLALGAPTGDDAPIVLDMSPAVSARGRIRAAAARGDKIPLGFALDADGRPTTDPAEALKGVVLPVGGPKGSGLAIFMDILGGVLTGAAYGGDVRDQYKHFDAAQNVGHLFIAIRPDLFVGPDEYLHRIGVTKQRIKHAAPAAGFDEVLFPGELEFRAEQDARRRGVAYHEADLASLAREAERAGVSPLCPPAPAQGS